MSDLLKVLDMSEEEQFGYLWKNSILKDDERIAELAFRLRDEAKEIREPIELSTLPMAWFRACYIVINGKVDSYAQVKDAEEAEHKVLSKGPIFWIIAALIAKEAE